MHWALTIAATVVCYTLFSYFGVRTAGSTTVAKAALAPVTNPIDFSLIVFGSSGFGIATFFAIKASPFAVTVVIALGLIVSFVFSVLVVSAEATPQRLVGLVIIMVGVWLLN